MLLFPSAGCGTICNLKDPGDGHQFMGAGTCYPFGGVTRSAMLGCAGPPLGFLQTLDAPLEIEKGDVGEGLRQMGQGTGLAIAGVVSLADVPLSLAGDIVTLPVAYARQQGKPWASWWGEKKAPVDLERFWLRGDETITPVRVYGGVGPNYEDGPPVQSPSTASLDPKVQVELEKLEKQAERFAPERHQR